MLQPVIISPLEEMQRTGCFLFGNSLFVIQFQSLILDSQVHVLKPPYFSEGHKYQCC